MVYKLLIILVFIWVYLYIGLGQIFDNKNIRRSYLWVTILSAVALGAQFLLGVDPFEIARELALIVLLYVIVLLPVTAFLILQDVSYVFGRVAFGAAKRRKRTPIGLIIGMVASMVFGSIVLWGALVGKTDFKVYELKIESTRVPKGFKGMKMVQISDLHLGSFEQGDKELPRAFSMINELNPDLIVLTGDILNINSSDMLPWISQLAALEAPLGKYAVIGNHDYAHYDRSMDAVQQASDLDSLRLYYRRAGFVLLENEHRALTMGADTIYIAGVENWGTGPFPALGDLDKAVEGIPSGAYTVLLSHDPAHFEHIVKDHPHFVDLTLSGHTHAMQFGVEWGALRWSPVQYLIPTWAGEYSANGRTLYVNRGLGYHFLPARVGIRPEITLIEF